MEVEGLLADYDLDVRFSPFLLDPTTPPQGKPRRGMTAPGDPPTAMEQRAESLGIKFTRGREWTSNSHLSLEAAEFAAEHGDAMRFHRAMFKAYFEDLADIGDIEVVARVGAEAGLSPEELRAALTDGRYRAAVDEGVAWAHEVGVTAVPTFVLGERTGIVGAQDRAVFEQVLTNTFGLHPKG